MRKIVLTLAIVAFASSAFAAATTFDTTPMAGITFVPSKNVKLGYNAGAGTGAATGSSNIVFSIGSKNTAGDRIYGATSASSAVAQSVSNAGVSLATTHLPTLPSTPSDSAIAGGANNWSIL